MLSDDECPAVSLPCSRERILHVFWIEEHDLRLSRWVEARPDCQENGPGIPRVETLFIVNCCGLARLCGDSTRKFNSHATGGVEILVLPRWFGTL